MQSDIVEAHKSQVKALHVSNSRDKFAHYLPKVTENMEKVEKSSIAVEDETLNKGPTFGARHVQAILLFTGITTEMMTRTSLSLSIVAMTDNSTATHSNAPTYEWKNTNVILSSFYWGYIVLQVLAGQLGKTYGSRWILFGAMSINACATTMIPFAAQYFGSRGVMACRVLQGLSQSGVYPTCHTMLGRWAPKNERGRMSMFVYSGINLGSIICLPITGLLSQSQFGWPVCFYLFGGLALLWSAVWLIFGHNTPASHPSITQEERRYIEVSLSQDKDTRVIPTPWKAMFLSVPFWAASLPAIFCGFGVVFLQNEIPTYLKNVLNYDISSSGYLTSLTAGIGVAATYVYGPLSDFLIERHYLSRLNSRKLFEAISNYAGGIALIILAFLDETHTHLSVFMFVLSSAFVAAVLFGHGVNSIDISPRFSGILQGFSSSISCIPALAAPLSVQYLVTDLTNTRQWRIVLLIAALSLMIPGTIFMFFASADRQWWDGGPEGESEDIEEKGKEDDV